MVNIYVGNLSWSCTNDDLMQLFSQHGTVARAQVILDRETGRSPRIRVRRDGRTKPKPRPRSKL